MPTIIVDGQPHAVEPAVARYIERLEGQNVALRLFADQHGAGLPEAVAAERDARLRTEARQRDAWKGPQHGG